MLECCGLGIRHRSCDVASHCRRSAWGQCVSLPRTSDVIGLVAVGRGHAALPRHWDGGVTVAAALLLGPRGRRAPHPLHLPVLLPHEQLHHQDLLLVDLHADVLGDVWNQPVHHVTHQHHHVLRGRGPGRVWRSGGETKGMQTLTWTTLDFNCILGVSKRKACYSRLTSAQEKCCHNTILWFNPHFILMPSCGLRDMGSSGCKNCRIDTINYLLIFVLCVR